MKHLASLCIALACARVAAPAQLGGYVPPSPTREVATAKFDWRDAKRNRDVPAKIYFPKSDAGPCPAIIFSHGLGGAREGYEYLGRHWAGCGCYAKLPGKDATFEAKMPKKDKP